MSACEFRYQILRYIPDVMRAEPRNIGIIVQSAEAIRHQINGRFQPDGLGDRSAARRNFAAWRDWFQRELSGDLSNTVIPLRTSREYLTYLASRCTGNYQLTEPLAFVWGHSDILAVRDYLYSRLVLDPTYNEAQPVRAPVQRFRQAISELHLAEDFPCFLTDAYVEIGGHTVRTDYYCCNGHPVLINNVQASGHTRLVQLELEAFRLLLDTVQSVRDTEIIAILDPVDVFLAQHKDVDERFLRMYPQRLEDIGSRATRVIDTVEKAGALAQEVLDRLLATVDRQ